ncbi:MAG TPA: hypothetical protein VGE16_08825 [Albitalea sp.]
MAWLLVCVALGLAVALAGVFISGHPMWYVAVPAAVALGWLFVADPTACERPAPPVGPEASKGGAEGSKPPE